MLRSCCMSCCLINIQHAPSGSSATSETGAMLTSNVALLFIWTLIIMSNTSLPGLVLCTLFFKSKLTVGAYTRETGSWFSSCCLWSEDTGKRWPFSDVQQSWGLFSGPNQPHIVPSERILVRSLLWALGCDLYVTFHNHKLITYTHTLVLLQLLL